MKNLFKKKKKVPEKPARSAVSRAPVAAAPVVAENAGVSSDIRCALLPLPCPIAHLHSTKLLAACRK